MNMAKKSVQRQLIQMGNRDEAKDIKVIENILKDSDWDSETTREIAQKIIDYYNSSSKRKNESLKRKFNKR